jgi:hypothetical protein
VNFKSLLTDGVDGNPWHVRPLLRRASLAGSLNKERQASGAGRVEVQTVKNKCTLFLRIETNEFNSLCLRSQFGFQWLSDFYNSVSTMCQFLNVALFVYTHTHTTHLYTYGAFHNVLRDYKHL